MLVSYISHYCYTMHMRPLRSYIYAYPSLELVQTLVAGTERSYSCAVFSPDGDMLASVGSSPDYLLTLWDWTSGATLLRCKAFSQEVYGVRFSPYFAGSLVTSGTGHIRFWRMADTFTGLKLQVGTSSSRAPMQQ
jgi:WD40 repeat protein